MSDEPAVTEHALNAARRAHAAAVQSGDKTQIAKAATAVWAILSKQPQYRWLLQPLRP